MNAPALLLALTVPSLAAAQDPAPGPEGLEGVFPGADHFSPYAGRNFPTNVYWGDTHLHTANVAGCRSRSAIASDARTRRLSNSRAARS